MNKINTLEVKKLVKQLFLDASYNINKDIYSKIEDGIKNENNPLSKIVLDKIIENDNIAKNEQIPMCQDTGISVIFLEIGQNVNLVGDNLYKQINLGVAEAYKEGYLRKSIVDDPLFKRINTNTNTPAIIHTDIVDGDEVKITVCPKGFGSENMSAIKMLKPSDGVNGVVDFVLDTVKKAGPNPCPPIVVGIGIGGSFEKAALLSKKALVRDITSSNENMLYSDLEDNLLIKINELNIGPAGFGGKTTALGVNIEYFPTHIAGLPIAINICCHACRHKSGILR